MAGGAKRYTNPGLLRRADALLVMTMPVNFLFAFIEDDRQGIKEKSL